MCNAGFFDGAVVTAPAENWWLLIEKHQTSMAPPSPQPTLGLVPAQPNGQRQQLGHTPH